ncbi:MAG: hypothetical protein JWO36_3727 [Myxococcales bacterium]|nr:hypothetical protein [Myxococcales bacterium]
MGDSLSLDQARGHWWSRQALGNHGKGQLAHVIGESGWLRTLGGTDVYLAARARHAGMKRIELDALVANGALRVVPAARGCIYLVPSELVSDLIAFNADDWRTSTTRDLVKLGKSIKDVESLAPEILDAIGDSALAPDAIRKQLGGSIPSFGEAGKKAGISSPLPFALQLLEHRGQIERTLEAGRLDSQRYLYRKVRVPLPAPSSDPVATVINAFLGFAGPATVNQIATWSGRPMRDVKPILEKLAVPIDVNDLGAGWIRRADVSAVRTAQPAQGLALLAFEDNYLVNHTGLAVVTDPKHHAIKIDIWGGGKPEALGHATHVLSRTIVIDGLIAGFWEVDPRTNGAIWMTFEPPSTSLATKLDEATADAARFLLEELGHAKTFSLDSMDDVQVRADKIRALRGGKPAAAKPVAKAVAKQSAKRAPIAAKKKTAKPSAKNTTAKPATKNKSAKSRARR